MIGVNVISLVSFCLACIWKSLRNLLLVRGKVFLGGEWMGNHVYAYFLTSTFNSYDYFLYINRFPVTHTWICSFCLVFICFPVFFLISTITIMELLKTELIHESAYVE